MHYKVVNIPEGKEILILDQFTWKDHDTFHEVISMIKSGQDKKIVLNLAGCSFIDSAAIGMFVIAHDEAVPKKVKVSIKGAQGKVKDVLFGTMINSLFEFEE